MPEICRFFGIVISLSYNDHSPPHFHVRYADPKAIVAIDSLTVLEAISRRARQGSSLSGPWRTGRN